MWSREGFGVLGVALEVGGVLDRGTGGGLCGLAIVVGEFLGEEKHSSIRKTRSLSAT